METITQEQIDGAHDAYYYYAVRLKDILQNSQANMEITVDELVAYNVTVATYHDIDRYKSYHLRNKAVGARSDVVKRAAYFTKWSAKLRPMMFKRLDGEMDLNDASPMFNEIMTVSWAMELIGSEAKRNIKLSEKAFLDLVYDLHYRELGDDALLALFQIVVDLVKVGKENPILEFSI